MTVAAIETRPLTGRVVDGQPVLDISAYEATDGYAAVHKAITMAPQDIHRLLKEANLRGRGGAGFSTGIKWGALPMGPDAGVKYLVCNADEMEPGTYKDRWLMEYLPHQMVEAMIVAGYAIEARRAYIFLRGEYVEAAERLRQAIKQAEAKGYLGENILGSGWSMDLHVHTGAGRYICGEETALINSLEGRRANPRSKPPFPQMAGLWGRPTIVNNVETLCNIPHIVQRGAKWFRELSLCDSGGTKLYGVSGRVKKPGLWELPMGVTARELVDVHAGGMLDGRSLKAWMPGGASTDLLLPDQLDVAMDFDAFAKIGSRMGTGLMMVIDDTQSVVSVVRNLEQFFARESCGWCTPCRDGLPWSVKLLLALERGEGTAEDIDLLAEIARQLGPGRTFCAHAPGAAAPLQTALKLFRHEFEQGIAPATAATVR